MDHTAALQKLFAEIFRVPVASISDETRKGALSRWDSLGHLDLVLAVENAFGIRFSAPEVLALVSFGKFRELVQNKTRR
jgi:acyl carrier protein